MKKNILFPALAIAACSLTFTSCDKVKDAVIQPATIQWGGFDVTITVPAVNDLNLHTSLGTASFTYNIDSFIKNKTSDQLSMANVDEFKFSSCKLTIQDGDIANNFANFDVANASFFTNANSTAVSIGEITNNPDAYSSVLSIPVDNTTNLRPYLPASGPVSITYVLGGKMRRVTNRSLTILAHVEYTYHAKP